MDQRGYGNQNHGNSSPNASNTGRQDLTHRPRHYSSDDATPQSQLMNPSSTSLPGFQTLWPIQRRAFTGSMHSLQFPSEAPNAQDGGGPAHAHRYFPPLVGILNRLNGVTQTYSQHFGYEPTSNFENVPMDIQLQEPQVGGSLGLQFAANDERAGLYAPSTGPGNVLGQALTQGNVPPALNLQENQHIQQQFPHEPTPPGLDRMEFLAENFNELNMSNNTNNNNSR